MGVRTPRATPVALRAKGGGSAVASSRRRTKRPRPVETVEPASPFDEARWLVERCGFGLSGT